MPEHLRALVVILVLATVVYAFAKAPACALASTAGDFERRRNLWFGLTLVVFLAHNFWIYIFAAAALLLFAAPRETNRLAMFFFLLCAVPRMEAEIPGLGIIGHFFTINYLRLLSLVVLLPAFLSLRKQPELEPFGRSLPDKLIAGHLILFFVLMLTVASFTHALRHGVFYAFIDIFLPYYVASRALKNLHHFRDALMGFVVGALVLSAIAVFEFGKGWLLYAGLDEALGRGTWTQNYLMRGGSLRAQATTGQPIPLAFVIAVAAGFFLYLRKLVPNSMAWGFGLVLMAGLIATLSRGPWVGAAAMVLVFLATGPSPARAFALLGVLGIIGVPVLLTTSLGNAILDYLPFVGSVDAFNVTYRRRLMDISIEVILQRPWFGAFDFYLMPEMQVLKQGQGIIDIVNTYLAVALERGLVGLSLFVGFFIAIAVGVFKGIRNLADRSGELYLLGQALLSTLLGTMIIILFCSYVGLTSVIISSVAGVCVAYTRMLALAKAREAAKSTGFQPATMESGSNLTNCHQPQINPVMDR